MELVTYCEEGSDSVICTEITPIPRVGEKVQIADIDYNVVNVVYRIKRHPAATDTTVFVILRSLT